MDTSLGYMKMCEKAEEIQNGWKSNNGDFYTVKGSYNDASVMLFDYGLEFLKKSDLIWLPRQDQLQEMVREKKTPETDMDEPNAMLLDRFYSWMFKERGGKWAFYDAGRASMEQLWLAFCMSGRYGKKWERNKWVAQ